MTSLPQSYNAPPAPADPADALRWEESRRRERLLSGCWDLDLERVLQATFGRVRRPVIGRRSRAKNPFRDVCTQLAANYLQDPTVEHPDGEFPELLGNDKILDTVGLWPLMRRVQTRLIGLREMAVHVSWSSELARPVCRMVRPDTLTGRSYVSAPGVPVALRELRWRGQWGWCWDSYSIQDGETWFRIIQVGDGGKDGLDLTSQILGASFDGDAYPWRYTQGERKGTPFLPYSLYHASARETLWDPYEGIELVDGTLDLACAWTYLQHTFFKAAFPQRWALNAMVSGAAPVDTAYGTRTEVATDPTSLLHLQTPDDAPQGASSQIGQWGPGADPEMLARVIEKMDRAIGSFDGFNGHEMFAGSSNPASAEALVISRDGQRQAQARYAEELEPSDSETLSKLAAVCNLEGATLRSLPESGWDIDYAFIPLSPSEAASRRQHAAEKVAAGLWSIVDAYMWENPGMLRSEAIKELRRVQQENADFGVRPGTAPLPYSNLPTPPGA